MLARPTCGGGPDLVERGGEVSREDPVKAELAEALASLLDAFEQFMDRVDWGTSFLDAETISKANTTPLHARVALRKAGYLRERRTK
jgi:hypothetical protein